jgi:hypothetical protein
MSDYFSMKTGSPASGRLRLLHLDVRFMRMSGILTICILLACSLPATAQATGLDVGSTDRTDTEILSIINSTGIPYRSGNRQDPFWHPAPVKTTAKVEDAVASLGLPPPGIAGTYIAQAALEGVSIGDDRRTAIIRGADDRAYFLREGDRLFDGYLKTINDDSIMFIRETRMRSGKTSTQEVTKRLRTP